LPSLKYPNPQNVEMFVGIHPPCPSDVRPFGQGGSGVVV